MSLNIHSFIYYRHFVVVFFQLDVQLNPNCTRAECTKGVNGSFANLVYVSARGASDDLHYFFSTVGVPAVVVIQTKPDPKIKPRVNWDKLLSKNGNISNSVGLTGSPDNILYSYGTVFTKVGCQAAFNYDRILFRCVMVANIRYFPK